MNKLGGQISPSLLDLNHLHSFYGPLPSSLGRLSYLRVLDTGDNFQLNGSIPISLGQLSKLEYLDLSKNAFVGTVFELHFAILKSLNELYLHSNSLVLNVTSQWVPPFQLQVIQLASIKFKGKVPIFQKWLTPLPSDVYNLLSGPITESDNATMRLTILLLSNNHLTGVIPVSLCKAKNIALIDFSNNQLSGKIPPCLGQLDQLSVLDLTNNSLYGEIPNRGYIFNPTLYHVGANYEENILDAMKGRELEYTKTLKFLVSMDLSNNGIVGEIPEELMDLFGLLNLNLSGNHLKGRIPNNIGNLTQLESLDFSRNKLSGPIPPSRSSLSYLSHLNMSFNNLLGRIPTGNQLRTLDDPSIYRGNNGLCGAPLNSCIDDKPSDGDHKHADESKVADETDLLWFYTGIGPGFLVGFLGVCGTLNFKKSWRYAYFQFIENIYNWISISIAIKFAQLRRKFNKGKFGG
ncbi:hypothetical protein ACSBR2_039559 [Camellia fascicularis]